MRRSEPKFPRPEQASLEFRRAPTILGASRQRSLIFDFTNEEPTPTPAPAEAPESTRETIEQAGQVAQTLLRAIHDSGCSPETIAGVAASFLDE